MHTDVYYAPGARPYIRLRIVGCCLAAAPRYRSTAPVAAARASLSTPLHGRHGVVMSGMHAPQKDAHFLDVVADVPLLAFEPGVYSPQAVQHLLTLVTVRGAVENKMCFVFDRTVTLCITVRAPSS